MSYVVVAAIGALVGASELLFRYRDSPGQTLLKGATWIYIAFNGLGASGALLLIRSFGWNFGRTGTTRIATQLLVAGFGSIALFRSNLFIVRAGDQNIGAGPSVVLMSLLGAADRTVDRTQASLRNTEVRPIMSEVDFAKAKDSLVAICLAASSNIPAGEAQTLRTAVAAIDASPGVGKRAKSYILGLLLIQAVGSSVLKSAVSGLGDEITY